MLFSIEKVAEKRDSRISVDPTALNWLIETIKSALIVGERTIFASLAEAQPCNDVPIIVAVLLSHHGGFSGASALVIMSQMLYIYSTAGLGTRSAFRLHTPLRLHCFRVHHLSSETSHIDIHNISSLRLYSRKAHGTYCTNAVSPVTRPTIAL